MKESHIEGLANHSGPESGAWDREGTCEAMAGVKVQAASALADLEDAGKVAERLLKNQDDIGNAIKPIYGDEAGKKSAALLRDHILVAAEVVKATKMGNNEDLTKANKKWYANADDIAAFLSGANPNWPKQVL